MLREAFGRWQVGRVRRAYTSVGGPVSDRPGYAGMVEEMSGGLATLPEGARRVADDRVFEAIFLGRGGLALLRLAGRRAPRVTSALMAAASPVALRWLVGPLRRVGSAANEVPRCRFREDGGPELCEHVCRRPTERFCGELGVPVTLTPGAGGRCDWRWGP